METNERDPVECLDCGQRWDDLDPEAEVCDCFDRQGSRRVISLADDQ